MRNSSYYTPNSQFPIQQHLTPIRSPAQFDGAIYDSDEFRMYEFKIRRCPRTTNHDWTKCPFAHRGERAARRDPRRFPYCAFPCPEFRDTGACMFGEACLFAHGIFEHWLHPERYRTRMCTAGLDCKRQVCFFAHNGEELRLAEPLTLQPHVTYQPRPKVSTDQIVENGLLSARPRAEVFEKGLLSPQPRPKPSPIARPVRATSSQAALQAASVDKTVAPARDFMEILRELWGKIGDYKGKGILGSCSVAEENDPSLGCGDEVAVD